MNKLPEDFKTKWIAALRSGEYKQGMSSMYDPKEDSFCCRPAPNVIPVMLTKDDLKGNYMNVCGCPVFKALKKLGYPVTGVGGTTVDIFDSDDYFIFEEATDQGSVIQRAIRTKTPTLIHLLKL